MENSLTHLGTFKDFDDGTLKSVFKNERGIIESTLIVNKKHRGADVFCVPTHHYCSLGCKMCHLTKEGANKPMVQINSNHLIESVIRTAHDNKTQRRTQSENCWFSFMGVGEPLLNLNLIYDTFDDEDKLKKHCGYKNITYALATMMPNRNLEKVGDYVLQNALPLKVHFSMHSPFTEERLALLPSTRVTIEESLKLLYEYRNKVLKNEKIVENFQKFHSNIDPTEIHYTLIEGHNDSDRHLEKMIELLKKYMIPFKILTFNPTGDMKRSNREEYWCQELKKAIPELKIKLYNPPGHQIGSSCGEFTKHYYLSELETEEEKQEFLDWKERHQIE